jgi:predicted unusual protein kinase regulating ubiquinone biosynthesis (AarF/ABC1/UbiB family)
MRDWKGKARAVPAGRAARLARIGGLGARIAGSAAASGLESLARGRRPQLRDLLLTPGNATRMADELARLRGAAMKVGQLLSMDGGDFLPPELAEILARLRADADPMPPRQLKAVLNAAWGEGWLARFEAFDVRPIAAASIGQVHRAQTRDGRDLAIKIQYPGVRASVASDVDNVGALARMSGLVPAGLDLAPLLAEAKRQLAEEADYAREAAQLARFADLLDGEADYVVPRPHADLSTDSVLAMDFIDSRPLEALAQRPQTERDAAMARLVRLTLRELFGFRAMQTDPNFANFRIRDDGRVVLLDFGATRDIPEGVAADYRALLAAGLAQDRAAMAAASLRLGFFGADDPAFEREAILDMIAIAFEALRSAAPFDYAASDVGARLRDAGMALAERRPTGRPPPMDVLYVQRKLAGLFLLGARIRARVALRPLVEAWTTGESA